MQVLTGGPTAQWPNLAFLFQQAIAGAKKRVYIQTPYFLPTEALLRGLQTAALSGVDVRVMIPVASDSKLLSQASSSYITESLQSGIKVYFYLSGMLHAKMVIVDDEFTSIGSTNFDFRSFEHNFEANIQIYSRQVCAGPLTSSSTTSATVGVSILPSGKSAPGDTVPPSPCSASSARSYS